MTSTISNILHSFIEKKLKAECASNHPVNSKQRAWRRDQIVIVRHLQTVYFFILRFTKVKHFLSDFAEDEEEGRKGRGRRMERERGEGQRWGIYMSGAIGYGELSWINSLFTLARRLLSESGEDGGRQVTRLIVMQRGGLANAAPDDWQECHLEQCRDSPRRRRPSSLEIARHCEKKSCCECYC